MNGSLSPIASTVLITAAPSLASDFRLHDPFTPLLPTALYVLGLLVGPLVLTAWSEIHGRRLVSLTSLVIFAGVHAGCALVPSVWALAVLRLAAGAAGGAGPTLGASSIGDLFEGPARGRAHAIYILGPTAGPVIGGVVGGFVATYKGWRWLMWGLCGAAAVMACVTALFQGETYAPYLLHCHVRRLRRDYPELSFRTDQEKSAREVLGKALTRPFSLLLYSPVALSMSLYLGV